MSRFDTHNRSYTPMRDTVIIVHVTRWMEAALFACSFLAVIGFLELVGG